MSNERPKPPSVGPSLEAILRLAREIPREQVAADLDDPELQALIERTVAPYVGVLTPKALDQARATLALVFTAHPDAAATLERQRREPPAGGSGVVVKRGAESLAEAAEALRRTGSRRPRQ